LLNHFTVPLFIEKYLQKIFLWYTYRTIVTE